MSFWDASAIVPLTLDQIQTQVAGELYAYERPVIIWWATRVECVSAITRGIRHGRVDAEGERLAYLRLGQALAAATVIEPSDELRERAEHLLAAHPLRAADALQLAAALVWARGRPRGRRFVCFDIRLREAARQEGFNVLPATL